MTITLQKEQITIICQGEELEQVETFKYLGAIITENGDCSKEIRARLGAARGAVRSLDSLWKDRSLHHHHNPHNHFTALFPGPPGRAGARRDLLDFLWCKGRLRQADTPTIRLDATPSGLRSAHLHHPLHIKVKQRLL